MRVRYLLLSLGVVVACSSPPPVSAPAWISAPTRTVDAGYIVYIGTGTDANPDVARFKAEGAALLDLANECSFAPKGARIEDRYSSTSGSSTTAYAKAALTFEECETAKAALNPEDVRRLANPTLADTIRRYQEAIGAPTTPPTTVAASDTDEPPTETEYYAARQNIFLAKQQVILYPQVVTVEYWRIVTPAVQRRAWFEREHPAVRMAPSRAAIAPRFIAPPAPRQFQPPRPPKRGPRPFRRRRRH